MEAVMLYLLKSAALIAMFWLGYHFLLRRETFFTSNRWYLLFGLFTSAVLPLITFTKIVWIEPVRQPELGYVPIGDAAMPVETFEINWWVVWALVYAIGISAFLLMFFRDFFALKKALRGRPVKRQADFKFVDINENTAPFSYFSYIVYNSSLYTDEELRNILEHEKVHSEQCHSADVLIARFFCIVFWFNPFIWLYKKSVLQNLEFIADSEALKNVSDKRSYQITLLKVTAHDRCVEITNHFYQSLIKKRIVMLNKSQSKRQNSWKYLLIVPALAAFMFYFQVKVIAQVREVPLVIAKALQGPDVRVTIDKNTTDAELRREAERVKKEHGVTLKFSKVKRNKQGEIVSIKCEYKDKNGKKGVNHVSGEEPIKPITFYKSEDAIGFGSGRERGVRIFSSGIAAGDEDIEVFIDEDIDIEVPDVPEVPELPGGVDAPQAPAAPGSEAKPPKPPRPGKHVIIRKKGDGKPMVIVDGKVVDDPEKYLQDFEPFEGTFAYAFDDDKGLLINSEEAHRIHRAMRKAEEAMERARPEMERALRDADRSMERARPVMQREAMEKARAEMEKAREDIKRATQELEKAREELRREQQKK